MSELVPCKPADENIAKKRGRPKKDKSDEQPKNRKRGRPKKEPKIITYSDENKDCTIDSFEMNILDAEYVTEDEDEEEDTDSDEVETLVKEFTFQNKLYYKCEENKLYDPESHIELGYWNPLNNTIVLSDV